MLTATGDDAGTGFGAAGASRSQGSMDLGKFQLFSMLTKRMAWLGQRQQVLAQNIANADTPGYVPRDLKAIDFRRMVEDAGGQIAMRTTNPAHLTGLGPPKPAFVAEKQKDTYETTPTGNAVILEEQLMKVSKTVMDYQVMANLYRKHVNMIKTALGRGNA
ncbi:MAG: flagellar basal body protein [Alphaproteobacteria bacterium]